MDAARRELLEETGLRSKSSSSSSDDYELGWHLGGPFACSDVIVDGGIADGGGGGGYHYVISQCFAELASPSTPPLVFASDDAIDARWWSIDEVGLAEMGNDGKDDADDADDAMAVTSGVYKVLMRSEALYSGGLMECN